MPKIPSIRAFLSYAHRTGVDVPQAVPVAFRAFLSYSHRDKSWAKWLHAALENYRIDKDLVGLQTNAGSIPKTLRPIFRDREDFAAGHSLTEQTLAALKSSQFLIVLCSEDAARSPYVNEEVRRFKAKGRPDRIIPIIVAGNPNDTQRGCFPPSLCFKVVPDGTLTDQREDPIAADARTQGDGKEIAKQKVVAGLLGLGLDEIMQRAARARRRRHRIWTIIAASFLVLAISACGSAFYAWQQLRTNEAFMNATLQRATEIVTTAVLQAEKYNVPRGATLELLSKAEGLFDEIARFGRQTAELKQRKALMLLEFANNYAILGKTDLRIARGEAAHELILDLAKERPNDSIRQQALWRSYTDLGDAIQSQGQLTAALLQHQAALGLARTFAKTNLLNTGAWSAVATSLERTGDIFKQQGQFNDAIASYREMLAINERLSADDPSNTLFLHGVSVGYERIGTVFAALGERSHALASYRRMYDVNQRLVARDQTNTQWQRNLSVSHVKIGGILTADGKLKEALSEYQSNLAISERLALKDPTHSIWQRDLAVAHALIGKVLLSLGDGPAAARHFQVRLRIFEQLALQDPANATWKIDLASSYGMMADTALAEGNLEAALESYKAGHEIRERLATSDSSNVEWQLDFLWSHSLLALFGDQALMRYQFIVEALTKLDRDKKLTQRQRLWLPVAKQGLTAVNPSNEQWQWDLLNMYWRAASLTDNPVGIATLVVAMGRKLQKEKRLTTEQEQWLTGAAAQVQSLRPSH